MSALKQQVETLDAYEQTAPRSCPFTPGDEPLVSTAPSMLTVYLCSHAGCLFFHLLNKYLTPPVHVSFLISSNMEQPWTLLTEITAAFNSTATCTETCVKHQHYSSGSTPLIPDSATGRNINFVSFTSDSHYLSQENLRVPQYYPPISFPVSEVAVFEDVSPPKY